MGEPKPKSLAEEASEGDGPRELQGPWPESRTEGEASAPSPSASEAEVAENVPPQEPAAAEPTSPSPLSPGPPGPPGSPETPETGDLAEDDSVALMPSEAPVEIEAEPIAAPRAPSRRRRFSAWFEKRAQKVVSKVYETRADDIEQRARRAVGSAYKDQADDLEERAVRAMRRAIIEEGERIKDAIEHGVAVKKREVRLSLLVLVTASALYLLLYWLTNR